PSYNFPIFFPPPTSTSQQHNFVCSHNSIQSCCRYQSKMVNTAWILYGALAAASAVTGLATQRHAAALKDAPPGITYTTPEATHPWSSTQLAKDASQHVQQLRPARTGRSNKFDPRSAAALLGAHQRLIGGFGYENITTTAAYGTQYAVETIFGGHHMSL